MAECEVCEEDDQFCIYCQQRFASTNNLHRHIHNVHPNSIRAMRCPEVIDD